MKRKNMTRNALFTSVISLLLCVSMLVGTTFAWFSDEVVSGNNVIASGNLDVELEYSKNGTSWATVNGATELFNKDAKWEPGYAEVVYLRLSNKGSLAFNYNFAINVSETAGVNVKGESFNLSDYIYFGVIEAKGGAFNGRRDEAIKAVGNAKQQLSAGFSGTGSMTAGSDAKELALVVYMPTSVENEANHNGTNVPKIDLGIKLVATQMQNENDSFGKDYDKNATAGPVVFNAEATSETMPISEETVNEDNTLKKETVLNNRDTAEDAKTFKTTFPAGTKLKDDAEDLSAVKTPKDIPAPGVKVGQDEAVVSLDITIPALAEDNEEVIRVDVEIGKGLNNLKVYHKGNPMTEADTGANGTFSYNSESGILTIYSKTFSPFDMVYADVLKIDTAEELIQALANETEEIVLDADIDIRFIDIPVENGTAITVTGTRVLNLNGYTLSGVSSKTGSNSSLIVVGKDGDLTVKNGTVTMTHDGENMGWNNSTNALEAVSGGKLTLDNVHVVNYGGSDMAYAVNIANNGGATLKVTNSVIESKNYVALRVFNNADGEININLDNGTELVGMSSPFFVHFWTEADLGNKMAARQDYLKVNFNDTQVSRYSGSKSLFRYGFTDAIYYSDADHTEVVAGSAKALDWALKNGKNVVLNNDILAPLSNSAIYGTPVAAVQKNGGVIDGNGYSLDIENPQYNGYAIETYGGTIKNLTIDSAVGRGIIISSPKADVYVDNVVVDGPGYAINTTEHNGKKLFVTNSTVKGWTSLAGLESASFDNCSFGENTGKYWQNMGYEQDYDRLIRPYISTTFTNCTFEAGYYIDLSALGADCQVTLNNCGFDADNYADHITIELPAGRELNDCVIFK